MRRVLFVFLAVVLLGGCSNDKVRMEQALAFRNAVLAANDCTFSAVVTTDYGDSIYTFGMACTSKKDGTVHITITEPETIKGITCTVAGKNGKILFDDKAVLFEVFTKDDDEKNALVAYEKFLSIEPDEKELITEIQQKVLTLGAKYY